MACWEPDHRTCLKYLASLVETDPLASQNILMIVELSLRVFCSFHFEMCMIIVVDLHLLFERISLNAC